MRYGIRVEKNITWKLIHEHPHKEILKNDNEKDILMILSIQNKGL